MGNKLTGKTSITCWMYCDSIVDRCAALTAKLQWCSALLFWSE